MNTHNAEQESERIAALESELAAQKQAFQESEARYRSLFEGSFEGVVIHEGGIILDTNPAFLAIFGFTREELIGQSVDTLIDEQALALLREKLALGDEKPYQIMGRRKNGARIRLEVVAKNHSYQGRSVRVAAVRDVSDQHDEQMLATALRDTAALLNSTLDPETVMNNILENLWRVVPHDTANIMLIEGAKARMHYWRGYAPEYIEFFRNFDFELSRFQTLQSMLQTGAPMLIPDTELYPAWQVGEHTVYVRAYLSVPVRLDGETIGFLNLDSRTPNAFSPKDAENLLAFANQAAVAIKNARLYDESRRKASALQSQIAERIRTEERLARRNQLLETLNALSESALTSLEEGHILNTLARLAAQAIDGTSAYVCDWGEDSTTILADYISPLANAQERVSDLGTRYPLTQYFDDAQALREQPALITYLDDAQSYAPRQEQIKKYGGYASLVVPLRGEDVPLGFIEIWDSRPPRRFSAEDVATVRAIARQVSLSIQKARLHAALKESEARNAAIVDALPDVVFRLDKNGRYLDMKLPNHSSLTPEQIRGRTLFDMLPAEVATEGLNYIHRALQEGEMQIQEYNLPQANGEVRYFEARIVVSGQDEVLAVVRDMTERKKFEDDLARARDEALEASRVKSQFLANMSHELRTPLNSIINYTQLMMDGIYGEVNKTQTNRLEKVIRNGQNLLALINDVLDLSKIEAGHMILKRTQIDTIDLISSLLETYASLAESKGLSLRYAGGYAPPIYADETRARQVLTNLIGNAIKFTHQGGITLNAQQVGDQVQISISDTGIGIPPEAQESVFDEFHQVDNTSTRQYEGSGLGLAISKKILELHGGGIQVESTPGKGSTFTVSFPIISG